MQKNRFIQFLSFADRPLIVRIWMWISILILVYYVIRFTFIGNAIPTENDAYFMAFGIGSIALYVLIYGFDWSK